MVQEASPETTVPALPVTTREPVFIAIIPLIFSLMTISGFVKEKFFLLWAGCIGLFVTGVLFIFSLGIHISIFGLIALIVGFALSKFEHTSN